MINPKLPLYKYLKNEHAQGLIKNGTFRIGTLYEFQDEEKHGSEVGDKEEGHKYIRNFPNETYDYSKPETVPAFARTKIDAPDGMHLKAINIPMQDTIKSPDYYLYCVTQAVSRSAMQEFGYDTVVKISNPIPFFQSLGAALTTESRIQDGFVVEPCLYHGRDSHYSQSDQNHPALIKATKHEYQKEVRAIWSPVKSTIRPVFVSSDHALKYCTILDEVEVDRLSKYEHCW